MCCCLLNKTTKTFIMKTKLLTLSIILLSFVACETTDDAISTNPSLDANGLSLAEGAFNNNSNSGNIINPINPNQNTIVENPFIETEDEDTSTFSIDADGASYAVTRRFIDGGNLPFQEGIRTEELVNYFNYDYPEPTGQHPISLNGEVSSCPWNTDHKIVRIGIKGKKLNNYPNSNLVFLIDVSGSMNPDDRLPMLQRGFKKFVDQLDDNDRVALATYAGNAGLVLESTSARESSTIKSAIDDLKSGGSTNGESGILLAYKTAEDNFIEGGNNRVIVATDGNFNVGISDQEELIKLIERMRDKGIFLTIIGVGSNVNEGTLEQIANNGNGNFEYLDSDKQLEKVFIDEYNKFFTVAKDVKVQVEFNKSQIKAYRLIGYENRLLENEDFEDDKKDAGEIGSDQCITALYEVIPHTFLDKSVPSFNIDFRYKNPDENSSRFIELDIYDDNTSFSDASEDHIFATAVASFGLLLRDSEYKGTTSFDAIKTWARNSRSFDPYNYKRDFEELVDEASKL